METKNSMNIQAVFVTKYIRPDGVAVQVGHKKLEHCFWKKQFFVEDDFDAAMAVVDADML